MRTTRDDTRGARVLRRAERERRGGRHRPHGRVRIYKVSDLSPRAADTFDPNDSGVRQGGNPANDGHDVPEPALGGGVPRRPHSTPVRVGLTEAAPLRQQRLRRRLVGDLPAPSGHDRRRDHELTRGVDRLHGAARALRARDIVDLDFVPARRVYVCRGARTRQRVVWNEAGVTLGSTATRQIDVIGNATIASASADRHRGQSRPRRLPELLGEPAPGVIDLTARRSRDRGGLGRAHDGRHSSRAAGQRSTTRPRPCRTRARTARSRRGVSRARSCHPDRPDRRHHVSFAAGRATVSQDGPFPRRRPPEARVSPHRHLRRAPRLEGTRRGVSGGPRAITTAAMAATATT